MALSRYLDTRPQQFVDLILARSVSEGLVMNNAANLIPH